MEEGICATWERVTKRRQLGFFLGILDRPWPPCLVWPAGGHPPLCSTCHGTLDVEDLHRPWQLCHSLPDCPRGPAWDWAPCNCIPLPLHSWRWRLRPRRLTPLSVVDAFLKGLAGPVPPAPAVNQPPRAARVPNERVLLCVLCCVWTHWGEHSRCLYHAASGCFLEWT